MKNKVVKMIAKGAVSILDNVLSAEANSTSCILSYQPKAPKELDKYKKTR